MTQLNVPHPSGMRRILIVEDEPLIAYSLTEAVTSMGFEPVGPIADLTTALEKANSEAVDAAILNLMIKGASAYGVAAVLEARGIPFAFASGLPREGLELPWQGRPYIEYPYSIDDVREVLQMLIARHDWHPSPRIFAPEPTAS